MASPLFATNSSRPAALEALSNTFANDPQTEASSVESRPVGNDQSSAVAEDEVPGGLEMVLGPLQVASISFVVVVLLVLGCGVAYAVGRSTSKVPQTSVASTSTVIPMPVPQGAQIPATPALHTEDPAGQAEPSLFGTPAKGQLYIQMSAIDRGMAIVFAEGLRKLRFQSLVAPGTNDHIFRVLVGPFATSAEFSKAKAALTAIGLDTFGRRYDEPEVKTKPQPASEPAPTAKLSGGPNSTQGQ